MTEFTASDADDLYLQGLTALAQKGRRVEGIKDSLSIGSDFGTKIRPTKELIPVTLHLRNPRERMIRSQVRKMDVGFALASALATAAGKSDLDFILPYNPRGAHFSDDGATLPASHAARLIGGPPGGQLIAAIKRLKCDPTTRRSTISIFWPDDVASNSRDVPCAVAIQFFIRDGYLHCSAFMRSQSAALVLPYDIFAFTFLQELVASELHIPLGEYWHICTSYHYYEDEEPLIKSILNAPREPLIRTPVMPDNDAYLSLHRALEAETDLRSRVLAGHHLEIDDLEKWTLSDYWQDVLSTLLIALSRRRGIDQPNLASRLTPYYAQQLREPRELE